MGFFSAFFGKVNAIVRKVWHLAEVVGINDEIIGYALNYIRTANTKYVDNGERREWVVKQLVGRGLKESVARLVVEMAFQIYRNEVTKKLG